MKDRGAVSVMANRFLDAEGNGVPLSEGLPSYEPVMPTEALQAVEKRYEESKGKRGFVVLDAWGEAVSGSISALLQMAHSNILIIDTDNAIVALQTDNK